MLACDRRRISSCRFFYFGGEKRQPEIRLRSRRLKQESEESGNVLIPPTPIPYDSAYVSDFWFSISHKRSYDSAYDSDSDSVASENQPYWSLMQLKLSIFGGVWTCYTAHDRKPPPGLRRNSYSRGVARGLVWFSPNEYRTVWNQFAIKKYLEHSQFSLCVETRYFHIAPAVHCQISLLEALMSTQDWRSVLRPVGITLVGSASTVSHPGLPSGL